MAAASATAANMNLGPWASVRADVLEGEGNSTKLADGLSSRFRRRDALAMSGGERLSSNEVMGKRKDARKGGREG